MKYALPPAAAGLISRLREAGYEAYLVGGAVRDLLSGRVPKDVDVATAATPEEVRAVFSGERVLETGLAHGTLTVLTGEFGAEITTFRREGDYSDFRHPDEVHFVRDLPTDLARRDYTVNAMALSLEGELVDPFSGEADLRTGILRCVGDASARFSEDALRILRGLRLSSEYGFVLEEQTRRAARLCASHLKMVARERIFSEFCRLLCGPDVERVLLEEREILAVLVPEVRAGFDFDHRSVYHCYDVYTHVAKVVGAVEGEVALRLAAFYHDLGKPEAYYFGEDGHGHFTGHGAFSRRIAEESLRAFGAPKALSRTVVYLVEHHDEILFPSPKSVRRALFRHGEEMLRLLLKLEAADAESHAPWARDRKKEQLAQFESLLEAQLRAGEAFTLSALAVGGDELIALGMRPSPALGAVLDALLSDVIEGRVKNERRALLSRAKEILQKTK